MTGAYLILLLVAIAVAYVAGRRRALAMGTGQPGALHSLPAYHGAFVAIAVGLPMLAILVAWLSLAPRAIENRALASLPAALQPADDLARGARLRDIVNTATGEARGSVDPAIETAAQLYRSDRTISGQAMLVAGLASGLIGFVLAMRRLAPTFRARNAVERAVRGLLILSSVVAVLTTIGIVLSVLFETLRFFSFVSPVDFLFGLHWSPQIALREDQVGSSGAFGLVPLLTGTLLIMVIAMLVAGPVGLFAAIYMAEYASPRFRAVAKPALEVLAGIPTVVYGFFAALTMAPFVRDVGRSVGLDVSSESALAAGIVMGVMITPFVSSLSDDVINAVPQSLRDGSLALGSTRSETIRRVVLPAALPGIVSAFMLAISKGIGETMIVLMAAGFAANLTGNPFEAVTTITVQIATLLVGDQEFDSPKTLAAFALGFVLFFFTLALNVIALRIVKAYREQYD